MIISENKRLILGAFILILVNIIWVLSSELTNYIFVTENYSKPFLSTYLKSSIFTLFLLGFVVSSHWRKLACPHKYYSPGSFQIDNSEPTDKNKLSDPIYVPVNFESSDDEENVKQDGDYVMNDTNEINDYESSNEISKRSVKFSKYSEVRHLSDTYAEDSLAARMSYNASKVLRKRLMIRQLIEQGYLPATNIMKIALQFCFFWFIANYSYQMGLSLDTPAVVNVISCTSSLFTLIFAAIFPSSIQDKFNTTKLFVVLLSMSGVVLLSFADSLNKDKFQIGGIIWSLISAIGYAVYLVNLRRQVKNEKQMSLPMFFGFVGFWTLICLWPGLLILHVTNYEKFDWPNKIQLGSLLLNGFLGTLGAELLWLWGCFLTSSLTATLSLGLSIPLSMIADYLIKKKIYDWRFYVGSIPILLSFICISYLTRHTDRTIDPIGHFFKRIFKPNGNSNYEPLPETDSESEDEKSFINISKEPNKESSNCLKSIKDTQNNKAKQIEKNVSSSEKRNKVSSNSNQTTSDSDSVFSHSTPSINTNAVND